MSNITCQKYPFGKYEHFYCTYKGKWLVLVYAKQKVPTNSRCVDCPLDRSLVDLGWYDLPPFANMGVALRYFTAWQQLQGT